VGRRRTGCSRGWHRTPCACPSPRELRQARKGAALAGRRPPPRRRTVSSSSSSPAPSSLRLLATALTGVPPASVGGIAERSAAHGSGTGRLRLAGRGGGGRRRRRLRRRAATDARRLRRLGRGWDLQGGEGEQYPASEHGGRAKPRFRGPPGPRGPTGRQDLLLAPRGGVPLVSRGHGVHGGLHGSAEGKGAEGKGDGESRRSH
jgi:hypothetical protein